MRLQIPRKHKLVHGMDAKSSDGRSNSQNFKLGTNDLTLSKSSLSKNTHYIVNGKCIQKYTIACDAFINAVCI